MRIISAPFGNYLRRPHWLPTLGTFTPKYRGNLAYRIWRCMRTLRYDRDGQGWVNRLGLPNPGAQWLVEHPEEVVNHALSIGVAHDDTPEDWARLLTAAVGCSPRMLEINASCPNEKQGLDLHTLLKMASAAWTMSGKYQTAPLFLKIPPVNFEAVVTEALCRGIHNFHACNTYPTTRGGLSGPQLRPHVLRAIKYIRQYEPRAQIIAGGGVQNAYDAQVYYDAGADHVAVGSAWFNPRNWKRLDAVPLGPLLWDLHVAQQETDHAG